MPLKMEEPPPETFTKHVSTFLRYAFVEERREAALVHLACQEIKPCLQFDPFNRATRRRKIPLRNEIRNVLDNRSSFGEQGPIIKHECGHVPERIHASEVASTGNGLHMLIDFDRLERKLRFTKSDMRNQRR